MVLLLPTAMWLIIRTTPPTRKFIIAGLAAVNLGCLVLNLLHITSFWFLWVSPAVLGLYLLARMGRSSIRSTPTGSIPSTDRALVTA
jgi:hypothetical protein